MEYELESERGANRQRFCRVKRVANWYSNTRGARPRAVLGRTKSCGPSARVAILYGPS